MPGLASLLLPVVVLGYNAGPSIVPSSTKLASWPTFVERVQSTVLSHPVVQSNAYTKWFSGGDVTDAEARDLVIQFSVFSNLFLEAQLAKVINAPSLDEMREGKEILANELGVVFNSKRKSSRAHDTKVVVADGLDHELVATEGSIEGGVFHFKAGHYEWLLDIGESLGVQFDGMGTRRHGCASTLHFCDALKALYGSDDAETALAASYAVENWAAAGFWDELVEGWKGLNTRRNERVPIGFWVHHAALEAQHADHTLDELKEVYLNGRVCDEEKFLTTCGEILDAIQIFWDGLDKRRLGKPEPTPKKDYSIGGIGYPGAHAPFGGDV